MKISGRNQACNKHKAPLTCALKTVAVGGSAQNNIVNNNNNLTIYQKALLPSFILMNARSLFPKMDELTVLLPNNPVDLAAFTESWLHDGIDDRLLSINGFNCFRKNRITGRGGGVFAYISHQIPCKGWSNLESPNFKWLWFTFRPKLTVCIVYHPPGCPAECHEI
mgnify:CR=1 FL=1